MGKNIFTGFSDVKGRVNFWGLSALISAASRLSLKTLISENVKNPPISIGFLSHEKYFFIALIFDIPQIWRVKPGIYF